MGSSAEKENGLLPLKSGCWAVIKLKLSAAVSPFSPVNVNIQLGGKLSQGRESSYWKIFYIMGYFIFKHLLYS